MAGFAPCIEVLSSCKLIPFFVYNAVVLRSAFQCRLFPEDHQLNLCSYMDIYARGAGVAGMAWVWGFFYASFL
jgi:hypothetical protein